MNDMIAANGESHRNQKERHNNEECVFPNVADFAAALSFQWNSKYTYTVHRFPWRFIGIAQANQIDFMPSANQGFGFSPWSRIGGVV
jgi:hypothetical protein